MSDSYIPLDTASDSSTDSTSEVWWLWAVIAVALGSLIFFAVLAWGIVRYRDKHQGCSCLLSKKKKCARVGGKKGLGVEQPNVLVREGQGAVRLGDAQPAPDYDHGE